QHIRGGAMLGLEAAQHGSPLPVELLGPEILVLLLRRRWFGDARGRVPPLLAEGETGGHQGAEAEAGPEQPSRAEGAHGETPGVDQSPETTCLAWSAVCAPGSERSPRRADRGPGRCRGRYEIHRAAKLSPAAELLSVAGQPPTERGLRSDK